MVSPHAKALPHHPSCVTFVPVYYGGKKEAQQG
jgi:hypothetical protein